jgi:ribosomal protein S12 methylthiotransferase
MSKKTKPNTTVTVGFVSLGCPKNTVDSESMLARIGQAGYILSGDIEADVVIVNTCGFIAPAKEEALEVIRQAVRKKKKGRVRKIIVTGCLPQRMGDALLDEVPEIDAIVGLGQRDRIAEIIGNVLKSPEDISKSRSFLQPSASVIHDDRDRLLINPLHWAYLRISEGCGRQCSFCTIPAIRGKFRSKPMEMVLSEARQLAGAGVIELNLIAQDTNSYGRDLGIKDGLVTLIRELEKIENLEWIRLMYLYPSAIDQPLIEVMAEGRKVVRYIDMPIQHIDNAILKTMRRADTKEHTIELINTLRGRMPDVVLRTTVIVGFPGETDEQFEELMEFIRWARFDALGAFSYFAESGTPAAGLPDQVPDVIKQRRLDALMTAQQEIAFEKARGMVGRELKVLADTAGDDGPATGRYYGQAPHIDSVCIIKNAAPPPGQFIRARVIDAQDYDLIIERIP